jgi:hypothetical protein
MMLIGDDDADKAKEPRSEHTYFRPRRDRIIFCTADPQESAERGMLPPAEPVRQPVLNLAAADNRRTNKDSHRKKDQHIQPSNEADVH